MKNTTLPLWLSIQRVASHLAVAGLLALAATAQAQSDNFNSGALGPNWATSVSANFPGDITFPADPFGGKALRLVASTSLLSGSGDTKDSPKIVAWRTDRLYTNFYVAVDVLSWNPSINRDTNGPLIALVARLTNVVRDVSVPVGRPDTMILYLHVNRFGGVPQGTRGYLTMGHLTDGQDSTPNDTLGVLGADFTLNPGHQYRMVFTGTNLYDGGGALTNSVYYGRVYDLQDLTRPLATIYCPDPFPGYGGFFGYPLWSGPGYSGLASIADGTGGRSSDVTFDNFVAAEYPPTSVSFPGTTNGEAGLPQVINRTPASYSNFYSPAGGITFTATTLGGGNVTSAKLFLNGVDVSAGLSTPAAGNSRNFSFSGSGLNTNMVYDARIELANAGGQRTTNVWTFDTFSDAYLASPVCINIECEDFDFGGGGHIDNPLASGWNTNITIYNNMHSVAQPWSGAFNQGASGYVNQGTSSDNGVDYHDVDGKERKDQANEADYRPLFGPTQSPGTTEGCPGYTYVQAFPAPPYPYSSGYIIRYQYDTQRKKYSDVDPGLEEYMLERLEGTEWYNYTRTFDSTNYYNVYLRHGSEFTEQLRLDRIVTGVSTNKLGEFYTTNAFARYNFRYAPLMTLVTPPNSLIANGSFAANASSFTTYPGYTGGANPSSITSWTDTFSAGGMGLNGSGTSVSDPFGPANPSGLTYAFIQGGTPSGGHALGQSLSGLAPSTTYTLVYSVAGRTANTASYRVAIYADNTHTTAYYDSGVQSADSSGFVTVSVTFTTPGTLGAAPNIQLGNWSAAGDNTVDFANVFLVPGSGPVTTSKLAVVNLSGVNKLRLTVDVPQEERTKQGLMLNYMAFVPALLVESSAQANTGYAIENTASIEPVTQTITIPQNGPRFYRLRWYYRTTITSITLAGGNVVLTYK
jgi:hypothetical protein